MLQLPPGRHFLLLRLSQPLSSVGTRWAMTVALAVYPLAGLTMDGSEQTVYLFRPRVSGLSLLVPPAEWLSPSLHGCLISHSDSCALSLASPLLIAQGLHSGLFLLLLALSTPATSGPSPLLVGSIYSTAVLMRKGKVGV